MPPIHDGLFGPASATWRVHRSPAVALVGGLRALILQALHPLAMAGVAQHSDYRERPLRRLRGTAEFVAVTTFGTREQAEQAARRVRTVHRRVRGTDPVTGRAYSADDPDTQVWIHTVEIHSFLAAHRAFGAPRLSRADEDRYFAENVVVAELLGCPGDRVPASVEEVRAYFQAVRPSLCITDAARDAISFVASPPLTAELAPYWLPLKVLSRAAVGLVPADLRRLAGLEATALGSAVNRAQVHAVARALALPGGRELLRHALGKRVREVATAARAAA